MNVKRIAIISQGFGNGGSERVAVNLANYFSGKYKVLLISAYDENTGYPIHDSVQLSAIITIKHNKVLKLIDRSRKILKEIDAFKPDKIISFITNEVLLTQLHRYPVIYSLRCDPSRIDHDFASKIIRRLEYRHADKVVFQTSEAREYYSAIIRRRGVVIPNPMDCRAFPYWKDFPHNNTFITACRLNKQKNIPMLIEAFAKLHEEYQDYKLEIYGQGELAEELSLLIKNNNYSEFIFLKGYSDHIHEIMAGSFAFVLCSDYEGLSNSMLEALAVGIPCICTDCPSGGAREFIRHRENGLLIPVGDAEALHQAMRSLLSGDINLNAMSDNAVRIRNEIDYESVCRKWETTVLKG